MPRKTASNIAKQGNLSYMQKYAKTPIGRKVARRSMLKARLRKHGLTKLDYYSGSSTGCQICRCDLMINKINKGMSVNCLALDHDHVTTKFRGFLCHRCNNLIGFALDNTNILRKTIRYLNNFSTINTIKEQNEDSTISSD